MNLDFECSEALHRPQLTFTLFFTHVKSLKVEGVAEESDVFLLAESKLMI